MNPKLRDRSCVSAAESLLRKVEVAEILACSVRHVERLSAAGRLTRVKLGRAVRFKLSEVLRLIQGGIA
jgi:excisionase family DNA binding protein